MKGKIMAKKNVEHKPFGLLLHPYLPEEMSLNDELTSLEEQAMRISIEEGGKRRDRNPQAEEESASDEDIERLQRLMTFLRKPEGRTARRILYDPEYKEPEEPSREEKRALGWLRKEGWWPKSDIDIPVMSREECADEAWLGLQDVKMFLAKKDAENAVLSAVRAMHLLESAFLLPYEPHTKRGLDQKRFGKMGGDAGYGGKQERERRRRDYQKTYDEIGERNPKLSFTRRCVLVAEKFDVSHRTIMRNVTR